MIAGLLELDEGSYLGNNRNWLPRPEYDTVGKIVTAASPATA